MLNSLGILAGIALIETFLGWLPYTPIELIFSLGILLFTTRVSNALFALFAKTTPTHESAYITAFILFFILSPLQSATDALFFILAGALAMFSKYLLTPGKVHIFNPAAVAAFVLSIMGTGLVTWWVGTAVLLPYVLIIGFFVLRREKQFKMFFVFIAAGLAAFILRGLFTGTLSVATFVHFVIASPVFFLGAFMLTDPRTLPWTKQDRLRYATLTGAVFALVALLPPLLATPALALLVGNAFAAMTGKRKRYALSLHHSAELSKGVYEFTFTTDQPLDFRPGQYMEWSLPHASPDKRGSRRYFFLTSVPDSHEVKFVTTMPVESSTFKDALRLLEEGETIQVLGCMGGALFPKDPTQKILAVADGLNIAPFISMFRMLADRHERRDMVLIYSARTPLAFSYQKELDLIKDSIGLRVIYVPADFTELTNWTGPSGKVTQERIESMVPDFKERCTLQNS